MKKPKLSAVVLTHNNEGTIEETLKSVSFCDEILVVDDHSTDTTLTRAKQAGAAVLTRSLDGDFAAQRNFGLTKASGDWVLFVDSDETVPKELQREIQEAIQKIDVNGFYLKRQDMMWGRALTYGETESVRLLRLARKEKGTWVRPVHEVWKVTGLVATLSTQLFHTPHPDVAHFLSDINSYSTINAKHLSDTGVRASWWHIMAYPTAKFFQNYLIRKGFLDGMPGLIVALMMSFHSFLTRAKLWQLQK
ncbi:MAG TPA: glycosyltransferase family 2 protein [Patescibacteria group bacterium]|nr:glycosyltransferase family 2 protein [Patescibacteria group bacterium]